MSNRSGVNHVRAVVLAAGLPNAHFVGINTNFSDCMLPINGKPLVGHIIDDCKSRGINKFTLVIREEDEQTLSYVNTLYADNSDLRVIKTSHTRGPGYSLYQAIKGGELISERLLIYLGDTLYKGKLNFASDFVVISHKFSDSSRWCFMESTHGKIRFINKPKGYSGNAVILTGVYYLKNAQMVLNSLRKLIKHRKIELHEVLGEYFQNNAIPTITADKWYDCGNIDNYYKAKTELLNFRCFNSLKYDPVRGIIKKSSTNNNKIIQEINWYNNIPHELKIFSPRLTDYNIGKTISNYSIEYYGYPTLAEIFLFTKLHPHVWQSVIVRLFEIVNIFRKYKSHLPYSFYYDIYVTKTQERLRELRNQEYWTELMESDTITVNNRELKNLKHFLPKISDYVTKLYNTSHMSCMHGDFFLGNILYDLNSRLIKLVDPKGLFGEISVYGDIKYDIAKLRHSFCGHYDFIVADLYSLKEKKIGKYEITIKTNDTHQEISKMFDIEVEKNGFSLEEIKFIEALLFLSMIPIHKDNFNRQKAMYITGIKLINEIKL